MSLDPNDPRGRDPADFDPKPLPPVKVTIIGAPGVVTPPSGVVIPTSPQAQPPAGRPGDPARAVVMVSMEGVVSIVADATREELCNAIQHLATWVYQHRDKS